MSQEQARALIARMKSDAAFREKVGAIAEVDGRMAFITGEGFTCTAGEIAQLQGELPEGELQAVTGGGCGHFRLCSRDDESLCWTVNRVVALRRRRPRGRGRRRRTATPVACRGMGPRAAFCADAVRTVRYGCTGDRFLGGACRW